MINHCFISDFKRSSPVFVLDLRELIIYDEYYISANWARGNEDDLLLAFLFTDMSPTPVMYRVHRIPLLTSLLDAIFVLGISPVQIAWENCTIFFLFRVMQY